MNLSKCIGLGCRLVVSQRRPLNMTALTNKTSLHLGCNQLNRARPLCREFCSLGDVENQSASGGLRTNVLRVMNLPFEATTNDLCSVFGLQPENVVLLQDNLNMPCGTGFLRFESAERATALMHKQLTQQCQIGQRHVALYPFAASVFDTASNLEGGHTHDVMMMNVPFEALENDIRKFFSPMVVLCVRWLRFRSDSPQAQRNLTIIGRKNGRVIVRFATAADKAMAIERDQLSIHDREVLVFPVMLKRHNRQSFNNQ